MAGIKTLAFLATLMMLYQAIRHHGPLESTPLPIIPADFMYTSDQHFWLEGQTFPMNPSNVSLTYKYSTTVNKYGYTEILIKKDPRNGTMTVTRNISSVYDFTANK